MLSTLCDRADSLSKLLISLRLLNNSDASATAAATAAPGSSSVLQVEVDVEDVRVDVIDTIVEADKLVRMGSTLRTAVGQARGALGL